MKEAIAYCDGACSGNPGPGGWGAVVMTGDGDGWHIRELGGGERVSTNNRMEIFAAIAVLEMLSPKMPAEIRTDSKYLVQGITQWVFGWQRKDWKTADGSPVKNRELWERLANVVRSRSEKVRWTHIAGHAGIGGNERADAIAVAFSKGIPLPLYEGPGAHYDGFDLDAPLPSAAESAAKKSSSKKSSAKGGFYVSVVSGRVERHTTWKECEARVKGASGAKYRKVSSEAECQAVLNTWGVSG